MQEENYTPVNDVLNASESFGKETHSASERDTFLSEGKQSLSERNSFASERDTSASERNDESFPKASESFGKETHSASETIAEILSRPERLPAHTLTAREVEKLFEQAGRPVTERSILNWCKPNSEGICRLNCGYERGERRWYIAPDSVERVIEEERRKDQSFPKESLEFSEASDRLSESFGKEPHFASERDPAASERTDQSFRKASETKAAPQSFESAEEHHKVEATRGEEEIKKERDSLQKRIAELEREAAAGQYKDELITTLRERLIDDRQDYGERMKFFQNQVEKLQTTAERYVEELVGINRRVGQLEAENRTLRQLPAGRPSSSDIPDNSQSQPEARWDGDQQSHDPETAHDQPPNHTSYHA